MSTTQNPFPVARLTFGFSKVQNRWSAALLAAIGLASMVATSDAQVSITVPNYSFETPVVPPPQFDPEGVIPGAPAPWVQSAQPGYFSAYQSETGVTWTQTVGVFANSTPFITNLDGNQAAYVFSLPGDALYQDLTAQYTVGTPYTMTVGVLGGSGLTAGDTLDLILYYRDGGGNMITLGDTTISYNQAVPGDAEVLPSETQLTDFSVSIPAVQSTDPDAGQPIGVEIVATSGQGEDFWDVDNVRLVPEPGTGGLLAFGFGGLLFRRSRRGARA